MDREIEAIKQALAACVIPGHRETIVLVPCWRNGFFGKDPWHWADLARTIGATMDEVMSARYRAYLLGCRPDA